MQERKKILLTQTVKASGWASKLNPEVLDKAISNLNIFRTPNLLVGFEEYDDAGVYKLSDEFALVTTVDFITPIVDDPYIFGRIAAANALSDIYSMGARPITALNLVSFPSENVEVCILRTILEGSLSTLKTAEVSLVGGHSIEDNDIKYGLCISGIVHPKKIIRNKGMKPGDLLILTKSLGTGIINTAIKAQMASQNTILIAQQLMESLNKEASESMVKIGVNACTDITGFGLLGHLMEMTKNSCVGVEVDTQKVPIIEGTLEFSKMGLLPGGLYRNKKYGENSIVTKKYILPELLDVLFDPQTSGGLLISVSKEKSTDLLVSLHEKGIKSSVICGHVIEQPVGKIVLT